MSRTEWSHSEGVRKNQTQTHKTTVIEYNAMDESAHNPDFEEAMQAPRFKKPRIDKAPVYKEDSISEKKQ